MPIASYDSAADGYVSSLGRSPLNTTGLLLGHLRAPPFSLQHGSAIASSSRGGRRPQVQALQPRQQGGQGEAVGRRRGLQPKAKAKGGAPPTVIMLDYNRITLGPCIGRGAESRCRPMLCAAAADVAAAIVLVLPTLLL